VLSPLPRLAACTIEREQINAWLTRFAQTPLRICLAPAGSGKTTALVRYAQAQTEPFAYIHVKTLPTERSIDALLSGAVGAERNRTQVIVDGIDRLTVEEQAVLERLVYEVPANVGLIFAGTTTTIDLPRLEAFGLAAPLPREALRFRIEELRALAQAFNLPAEEKHLEMIQEQSDGWAVVLADILRIAAAGNASLLDGYERWFIQCGRTFATYLREELERFPTESRACYQRLLSGESLSAAEIAALEHAGAWLAAAGTSVRPYAVVADLLAEDPDPAPEPNAGHIIVRFFGRFSIQCGAHEVSWIRRRDQQVFRYAAIRPSGRVSKMDLIEAFWPDADPHLAAQSLRTACSNIRKALAGALDPRGADRIFRTDGSDIVVDFADVLVDVHRFRAHVNEGQNEEDHGRAAEALAHYRAAQQLARADFFGGEPPEEWFVAQREIYREMLAFVANRIKDLRLAEAPSGAVSYTRAS
jgi:hypothetical protein